MQYLLLLHVNEAGMAQATPEQQGQMLIAFTAYRDALAKENILVANARLTPSPAARTIQTKGGKTVVMDGPFTETKEQIGGYYLIDVPDMETAITWAERCPAARHGAIEVRALWG